MIKLANKIALAALFPPQKGMEKSASMLTIPAVAGALAGGLTGHSQRNDDESLLKPALGTLTGAAIGLPGGLASYSLGDVVNTKLEDLAAKIKHKKAKAILTALARTLPTAGLVVGSAGAGALSGLGTSKLKDM